MPIYWIVIYVAIAIALFFYLIAPALIRRELTHQARYTRRPAEPGDLPEAAAEGIRRMIEDLVPLGFHVASHTFNPKPVPRVRSGLILFLNRSNGDVAQGIYTIAEVTADSIGTGVPGPTVYEMRKWLFTFNTTYESGRSICTASSTSATVFPANPMSDTINVSWISSPAEVYRIHRARVDGFDGGSVRPLPNPGEEIEYLDAETTREMQRVADAGYFWLDAPAGVYRKTWKGAYIMTWRLLPPWRQLRRAKTRRKARRELRRLWREHKYQPDASSQPTEPPVSAT